jgi:SAM-dependent methyltransferase
VPLTRQKIVFYARKARQLGLAGTAKKVASRVRGTPIVVPSVGRQPAQKREQTPQRPNDFVDVKELLQRYTVEQLAEAADEYYVKNVANSDYYFAKPLTNIDECPDFLICFAQMVGSIRPLPGMRVLDFGAGTGWTSRFLTQLGCEVVAVDVSPTALKIAEQLFERLPVVGNRPAPTFQVFDGRRLDLEDDSVDVVFCFDAFHHIPNPAHILQEFGRVLKDGGVAGFNEPGPRHSETAQSQFEMKNYVVIENDIDMQAIWPWAQAAGFTNLDLAVNSATPFRLSLDEYDEFLDHGGQPLERYYRHVRSFADGRRMFFLAKGQAGTRDSRERRGLLADLQVDLNESRIATGEKIQGLCRATNTGTNWWLGGNVPIGLVQVGIHLYDADGRLLDRDFARAPLPTQSPVAPGQTVKIPFEFAAPPTGRYGLEFDMVSEMVCWFEINGATPMRVNIEVV